MTGSENAANEISLGITAGIEIRRASIPSAQGATQAQQFELVEIAAATVPATAVAIVLDLSDSCGPMPTLLARLPTLLAKLPRKWPIWIYCLSNPVPVDCAESINVGHLIDGSKDISSILADRTRRQTTAGCGSFVGLVVGAIHERRAIEGLDEALVIVLTDGHLTDFSPVNILSGLRLVGLTDNRDRSSDMIWRSVFPNQQLFRLTEPDIDVWLDLNYRHSARQFRVILQGEGLALASILNDDGTLQPTGVFEWNSRMPPCRLLLPSATADTFDVILNPTSTAPQIRLAVSTARSKPSVEAIAAARAAILPSSSVRHILIDAAAGESDFDILWAAAAAVAGCCDQGRRWSESLPVIGPILKRVRECPEYRAALCLCRDDPRQPFQPNSRLVVIGMRQDAGSTIVWVTGQSTPFGVVASNWRLRFDHMEGRWILSRGSEGEIELRPQGSQLLGPLKLVDGSTVSMFFSGTL